MGGVNHQGAIKGRSICQLSENFVENPEFAPSDEPIIQRLVRTVFFRRILPLKPVLDDVNDAADDAPVIDTGNPVRTGKERLDTFELTFGKIKQGTHETPPCPLHTLFGDI